MTRKVTKVCDHLIAAGEPKVLVCPACRARTLQVVTVKHNDKPTIAKLVCVSDKCRRKIAYDVTFGHVSR